MSSNAAQDLACLINSDVQFSSTHSPPDDYVRDLSSDVGSATKRCVKFFSTSGCPYGDNCHFLHFVSGGIHAVGIANLSATMAKRNESTRVLDPTIGVSGYKTKLCNRYSSPEGCQFGEHCHFAHGESEQRAPFSAGRNDLHPNTSEHQMAECTSCLYSSSPLYPHDNVSTSLYYGEPTPPGVTITTTFSSKMRIQASMAGAVIGRAGGNVRQINRLTGAKLSLREHETDSNLRNIELEGLPEQIESARQLIRLFLQTKHAPSSALKLSSQNLKTKLCHNFNSEGRCMFAEHCHFAHGASELRAEMKR